jgi:hypothetical protein
MFKKIMHDAYLKHLEIGSGGLAKLGSALAQIYGKVKKKPSRQAARSTEGVEHWRAGRTEFIYNTAPGMSFLLHWYNITTGCWFQTFFIFHNIWDNPSH